MLLLALLFLLCPSLDGVQINFYSSLGQVLDQVTLKNGLFETYFSPNDYNDIVKGTIDFPGMKLIEQDLYSTTELLRNTKVQVRAHADCKYSEAKLVDPNSFLVEEGKKFFYTEQKNIKFNKDPNLKGQILSVRLNDTKAKTSSFTYLTNGLSWTPRYELTLLNENSATLSALVDIVNSHQRAYQVSNSTLTSGTVYLSDSSPSPIVYALRPSALAAPEVSTTPTASDYGTYTYQIKDAYTLYPRSTKTLPFITPTIVFAYTLQTTSYIPSGGSNKGQFYRTFNIKPSEFLPAGPITFYQNQLVLGQASISDTAKNSNVSVTLGTDPDVQYTVDSIVTATRKSPYGQDLSVNVTIVNRKEKQTVSVQLTLNGGYLSTVLSNKNTSSGLTITQDRLSNSTIIIQATIPAGKKATGSFNLKQSN